ncbi:MAG TPA: NAD-dependent succinate-semialdehyde dehydrogenase [Candidatus Baltobacteraceae bacterium]|nr:NAD-dependent succinate-semialdehyde dehydrogenase [Candidatus Baltobacteraceae bacterium]
MAEVVTRNPATGAEIERFTYMPDEEVDGYLDAAQTAFTRWRREPFETRAALLRAVAGTMRSRSAQLAETAVREMGKPVVQARAEVEKCAWTCEYFADNAQALLSDAGIESNATRSYVAFRPLGPIFAIMPWNFPYWQVFRAAAPALMAGNTMVLKHADNTTRCALEIERIFTDAGAPEGVFKTFVMHHDRADELIADSRIAGVTLTGSERAGVAVGAAAGKALKKCVLELGGSDPFIVLPDADIDLAVEYAVKARFQNNGQSCIAAKRFIVDDRVYDRFVSHFAQAASEQRIGDPMVEQTQIGPCAREDLRDTLYKQVTSTVVDGARIVTGGRPVDGAGYYFEPTVVADVAPGSPMFAQETFGPAAAVVRATDDDHALQLANDSSFGLGANIWTRDVEHAARMAAQIESGMVFVNGMVASDPRLPFGGVKRSGYGRELSSFGIHEFVNIQTVWIGPEKDARKNSSPAE